MASAQDTRGPAAPAVAFEVKLLIAALFWGGGYAVLAVRAALIGGDSPGFLSEARLVATLAGSAMLLAVMLLWERLQDSDWRRRLAVFGGAVVLACAAMFVVRLMTAQLFGLFGPTEFADGARWLIAWAGYFLAAVSTFVAFVAVRRADALERAARDAAPYEIADDIFV